MNQCSDTRRRPNWTVESAHSEALKFSTRTEFKLGNSSAYNFLWRSGKLDDCTRHMEGGYARWSVDSAHKEALKFSNRIEFQKASAGAYEFLWRAGKLDEACSHMPQKRVWTIESATEEAKKYSTRSDFQHGQIGAYEFLTRCGALDDACFHMGDADHGYKKDESAILYYLMLTTKTGERLWKIGVTNKSIKQRIRSMGRRGSTIDVIRTFPFASGREARMVEKAYHREFRHHAYGGDPVLGNGNTELFTADVLGLCHN